MRGGIEIRRRQCLGEEIQGMGSARPGSARVDAADDSTYKFVVKKSLAFF